jgi:hypothetical protein
MISPQSGAAAPVDTADRQRYNEIGLVSDPLSEPTGPECSDRTPGRIRLRDMGDLDDTTVRETRPSMLRCLPYPASSDLFQTVKLCEAIRRSDGRASWARTGARRASERSGGSCMGSSRKRVRGRFKANRAH